MDSRINGPAKARFGMDTNYVTIVCIIIVCLFFVIIYWIVDEKGKFSWFEYINIAGTSTLTCYLIPYYYYNMISFSNWTIPIAFTSGIAGLIKSALFAFLIIGFTWIFSKIKLHIRI